MRYALIALMLFGCATTEPGKNVGPYTAVTHDKPSCSEVTISKKNGKNRATECDVR